MRKSIYTRKSLVAKAGSPNATMEDDNQELGKLLTGFLERLES